MMTKGSLVNDLIHGISNLSDFAQTTPSSNDRYVNKAWFLEKCNHMENCEACFNKRIYISRFLLEKSSMYVEKTVNAKRAVYGMTLLKMVNDVICEDTMPYTVLFELDLKLQILAQSAPRFQQMHDDFLQGYEDLCAVDKQKAGALIYLGWVLHDKKVLKNYCQDYLKLAVEQKVKKIFKEKLNNDYASYMCAVVRSRQEPREGSTGPRCGHHAAVDDTLENICNRFTDEQEIWVLLTNLVSSVIRDIMQRLNHPDVCGDIGNLVASVCSVLEERRSSDRGHTSGYSLSVEVLNFHPCVKHLKSFVKELEKQFQEELIPNIIMEHYMECPCVVWREKLDTRGQSH